MAAVPAWRVLLTTQIVVSPAPQGKGYSRLACEGRSGSSIPGAGAREGEGRVGPQRRAQRVRGVGRPARRPRPYAADDVPLGPARRADTQPDREPQPPAHPPAAGGGHVAADGGPVPADRATAGDGRAGRRAARRAQGHREGAGEVPDPARAVHGPLRADGRHPGAAGPGRPDAGPGSIVVEVLRRLTLEGPASAW